MKTPRLLLSLLGTTLLSAACQTAAVLPAPGEAFALVTLQFET